MKKVKIKKILFVCKYNRFRSRIAEQLFKKYNKNKKIEARSAGVFKGINIIPIYLKKIVKEFGIEIKGKPKSMSYPNLFNYSLIVIVANDVPRNLFKREGKYNHEILRWKIPDNYDADKIRIRKIVRIIEKKVIKLVKDLKN